MNKKKSDSSYVVAYMVMAFLLGVGFLMGWLSHIWIMG
jgi:hypothetical protein